MFLAFLLLDAYTLVLLVSVALSWLRLSPGNPVVRVVTRLTEPVLAPIRKVMPDLGGFDLSPMVVLFGIQMVKRLLSGF